MPVNGPTTEDGEDSADKDIDDEPSRPQSRMAPPPQKTIARRRLLIGGGGAAVLAVLGGGTYLISSGSKSDKSQGGASDVTTFRDPQVGFSVAYPTSWVALPASDPTVPLILSAGSNGLDSFEVRVLPTQTVDPNNLADVKSVTDAILSGTPITVRDQKPVTINGIRGYYYLYTLADTATGKTLAHSHYFLFQGHSVYILVFQALESEFAVVAPSFDRVLASFRLFSPTPSATTSTSTQ